MEPESAKHTDNIELKSWLDSLQQESWQLELLISGFSTFLLIQGLGWFEGLSYDLTLLEQQSDRFALLDILHHFGRIGWMSLLISLLFHVVMRGLWISAIGLRSVSGEIDYTTFRFRPRYVKRLQNGIGSFDDYIDRLERYCSVLFSFAFLLLFCFLGISCYVFTVGVVMNLPEFLGVEQNELVETITEAIGLIILILGVIYMLDFFTLGLLKRIKWIEKPYYYLYVAMGWITLARFYRPLYYNFTDNSFGRKFAVILPFCVMIIYFGSAVEYVGSAYTPGVLGDGRVWINNNSYDDANDALASRVWGPSLSSKYAKNDYIECFVPYIPTRDDETLLLRNDDLNPARMPGFVLRGKGPHIGESVNQNADFDALLEAMAELHQLRIDSVVLDVEPRFHNHTDRKQYGLLYIIPTHDLPRGEHALRIDRLQHLINDRKYNQGATIYFYR